MYRLACATALFFALATSGAAAAPSLPDPTERTSVNAPRVASAPNWSLESTLVSDDRRIAVINGETVAVGDRIRGARVDAIETYGVRLRTAGGVIELSLSGTDPKQTAVQGRTQ